MLVSEARVETERPNAYLIELCRHVHEASQAHQRMQAHVEWTQDHGMISFGGGRCTLCASPGVLTLRAEASDAAGLQRVERRVANRLKRLAGNDRLTVTWAPPQGAGEGPAEDARTADPPAYPDTGEDVGAGPDRGPSTGIQSWAVKVFLILALLALILIVVLHLMGGGLRGLHG